VRRSTDDVTLRRWLAFQLGTSASAPGVLAVPKWLLWMQAHARLRRLLLEEGSGHGHVFEP
jgi:hypothetical protein